MRLRVSNALRSALDNDSDAAGRPALELVFAAVGRGGSDLDELSNLGGVSKADRATSMDDVDRGHAVTTVLAPSSSSLVSSFAYDKCESIGGSDAFQF